MTSADRLPRFSIVTAVHDVEPYLPAFIDSVERLRAGPAEVEVVAVDDGSTDGSLELLLEWARRSRFNASVVTKPNGGQASARNMGLDRATGEWVTFPDPDDLLDPDYLRVATQFARAHPAIDVLSARPVLVNERTGETSAPHPRRWQYRAGNRVADLDAEPNVFLGVSSGSFFRLGRIANLGLRFDTRIRPNFEDAHFAARYLLALSRPEIGLLRDSVYGYRKRAAGTSTLQGSMRDPGRYSAVPELGYLDILERARRPDGGVPAWVQNLVVYELSWYLSEDEKGAAGDLEPALLERFHALLGRVLGALDPAVVARHGVRPLTPVWRDVLAHAARGTDWHASSVVRSQDREQGLRRYTYRYTGRPPVEVVRSRGSVVPPARALTVAHAYFGREILWERRLWIGEDRPAIELDGDAMPIESGWYLARPAGRRPHWRPLEPVAPATAPGSGRRRHRFARLATRVAAGGKSPLRRKGASALLVLDRILSVGLPGRDAERAPRQPREAS